MGHMAHLFTSIQTENHKNKFKLHIVLKYNVVLIHKDFIVRLNLIALSLMSDTMI